jgi:hypothetical protein
MPAPHDSPHFNIDAFIRDLTTMAPTIGSVMTMDQSQLSRTCLNKLQEPGGRGRNRDRRGGALRSNEARECFREHRKDGWNNRSAPRVLVCGGRDYTDTENVSRIGSIGCAGELQPARDYR